MTLQRQIVATFAVVACLGVAALGAAAQQPAKPEPVKIPDNASGLEGLPTVRVDAAEDQATRRQLGSGEAINSALKVRIVDGRYYWGSRDDRPLTLSSSGGFTYLSSATEPGHYVRLRQVGDRITYAEHVDMASGSVTYWGELRIVIGK